MPSVRSLLVAAAAALLLFAAHPERGEAQAGTEDWVRAHRLSAEPTELELRVGEEAVVRVRAEAFDGTPLEAPVRFVGPRGRLDVNAAGRVVALEPGEHQVVAFLTFPDPEREPLEVRIGVRVRLPAPEAVEVGAPEELMPYVGTTVRLAARARLADGSELDDAAFGWTSSDPDVATVDAFGRVTGHRAGSVGISAEIEGVRGEATLEIRAFEGAELQITGGEPQVRTGDVQRYEAVVRDDSGREVPGVPVTWSLAYEPDPDLVAPGAPGLVDAGRTVANLPGVFTVVANAGPLVDRTSFRAEARDAVRQLEVVGQGRQAHVRTTDLWVWEGVDGRDYALTGAKLSDGTAYVWDITDPADIRKTDSIRVDARSINDVKVSPDGRYATLTREGASHRGNGLVILDLADPAHPVIASETMEGLTGGVHNAFPTDDHVFALSAGEKYLILDVTDIYRPRYVSEVQHGDCRIHDVWVRDGLAFSAQWGCGLVVYDVGHGGWGGSIAEPAFVSSYVVPGGRTHAAFPYHQESTGRTYVFIGDEIMSRRGLAWAGVPGNYQVPYDPETGEGGTILTTTGYVQVIDFTDPESPEMVARYEVPEYGTHNIWVEDDMLYQAYYEGGLRIVDVSGELMGNLYTQGREIAVHKSADPIGYVPNSPMVWSAMPHKGRVFFSDTNSGLWSVRLLPAVPVM